MPNFFKKPKGKKVKKFILIGLLVVLISLILVPGGMAHAGLGTWVGSFFISIIALVLYLVASITTFLMQLAGSLLSATMSTTFSEGLYLDAPFVQVAWGFCRDFANILFILWLVIIALSIMLNIRDYGSKKLLARLIAVAILVNFSLVLCGFMLDIAQGTMGFLTQAVIILDGKPYSLAEGLTQSFKQSELFGARLPNLGNFFGAHFDSSVAAVMHNFLVVFFGGVAAYVFILLAVMLLVRVAALWLLLILAPLAWTFGIMPFAKKAFSEWMKQFFTWAFYGVIVSFYMYLAAMAVWAIDRSTWGDRFSASGALFSGMGTQVSFLENFASILSFIVVIILLMMAKNQAKSGSKQGAMVVGAVGGYIMGKLGRKGLGGWAQKRTIGAASNWAKNKGGEAKDWAKSKTGAAMMSTTMPRWTRRIGGQAAERVIARRGAKMKADSTKAREKRKSDAFDYSNLSEEEKISLSSNLRGAELEKLTEQMIKDGSIQKLDKSNASQHETLQRMYRIVRKQGNEKLRDSFEDARLDMITDHTTYRAYRDPLDPRVAEQAADRERRRKRALDNAIKKGTIKNEDLLKQLSPEQLAEVLQNKDAARAIGKAFEDFAQSAKDTILNRTQEVFNLNFDEDTQAGKQNIRLREFYAKNSGNYHEAFNIDPYTLNEMPQAERNALMDDSEIHLKEAISKIRGEKDWNKVDLSSADNARAMARYIEVSQINNAGRYLDSNKKEVIYRNLIEARRNPSLSRQEKKERTSVYGAAMKNDLWPGSQAYERLERMRKYREERIKEEKEMNKAHGEAKEMNRAYDRKREEEEKKEKRRQSERSKEARKLRRERERSREEKLREDQDNERKRQIKLGRAESEAHRIEEERQSESAREEKKEKRRQSERSKEARKLRRERERSREEKLREDQDNGQDEQIPDGGKRSNELAPGQGSGAQRPEATIQANQVEIKTDKPISVQGAEKSQLTQDEGKEGPTIIVPEEAARRKFTQTSGFMPYRMTPQQKKDFEETKQAKRAEAIKRMGGPGKPRKRMIDTDEPIKQELTPKKDVAVSSGEKEERERDLREKAISQAEGGKTDEAIETANNIDDEEKRGYALWAIASAQADKNSFNEAFRIARQIKDNRIQGLALRDIEMMQERKKES